MVQFDLLPDSAIAEIAAPFKITGTRGEMLSALNMALHCKTYDELDPIFKAIKTVADNHKVPEAVSVIGA